MESSHLSGSRLCNALPQEDHHYGMPSLKKTNIMECPPLSGPILWNAHMGDLKMMSSQLFEPSAMVDLTLYKLQPIIIASQMKLISA